MTNTRKKKSGFKWRYFFLFVIVAGAIAWAVAKQQGLIGQEPLTKVSTEKVERRDIIETVSANGKVYPEVEVAITPDVSGEVVTLKVAEGDSVRAGQLLARINPDIYGSMVDRADAAVNSAKANQANAEARLSQLHTQLGNAQKTYNRNRQLLADEVISQVELDNAEIAVKNLQGEIIALQKTIEGAQYNVKSAEASYKEAQDNLNKTNMYAPMSGIVSKVAVEKGERVVGTSQMSGTEMVRIANFNSMEARVDVSENDILRIAIGDTAIVTIDAYSNRNFKGTVTEIANSANEGLAAAADQITNFTVKIRLVRKSYADLLKKHRFPFRPGMSVAVDIQTKKVSNVLAIPIQAVTTREIPDSLRSKKTNEEELKEVVYVYTQDTLKKGEKNTGTVEERAVNIGIQDESYIEVTKGLTANEVVVSAPYRTITKELANEQAVECVKKEELYKKQNGR